MLGDSVLRKINLCHLYSSVTSSEHVKKILNSFEKSVSIDINSVDILDSYDVFIVELEQTDKESSLKIRKLLESQMDSIIYFIVPKAHNIMFFQLAFMLNAKTIITQRQDTDKVIAKIKNDFKHYKDNYLEQILGKSLIKSQDFLLFREKKLIFASQQLLKDFSCKNLEEVKAKLFSQLDIDELLLEDGVVTSSLKEGNESSRSFFIKSVTLSTKDEKVISLEPYVKKDSNCSTLDSISSRTSFIELLKDKLLEKSISDKSFSIITIQVENLKALSSELDKAELENLFKELLFHIGAILETKLTLAQFNMEFYVTLFEDISFEDLKEVAQNFYTQLPAFISKQKFKPLITLFAFDINNLELNTILQTLENIADKQLSDKQIESENLKYISNIQDDMSDKEIIDLQLNANYINGTEFKLLNIYKGLCINTSSKIIKKTDTAIYIKVEHLQGILMQSEKETVMQFSAHVKDIRARVKYVNLEKKFAILEEFSFLNSTANARKYSRVSCSNRTPIVISSLGGTLHGEVLDISINSIAIKTKLSKTIADLKFKHITLTLTLPLESNVDGYVKLSLGAKVSFSMCDESSCKVICELLEDSAAEAIIMEYVYNRQKELIVEVKKMVINSNF